jgi:hypothetical protein
MKPFEILCPHCGESVEISEAIAAPLINAERQKAGAEVGRRVAEAVAAAEEKVRAAVECDAAARIRTAEVAAAEIGSKLKLAQMNELAVRKAQEQLRIEKEELELTIQRRIDEVALQRIAQARVSIEEDWQSKLEAANACILEKDAQLRAAEAIELEAREVKRQAEEAQRQLELTVTRRMDEERAAVRESALRERDEEARLKLADKDKLLGELRDQIDELRRKGDRPAQQLTGDVLELDLHALLSAAFPLDTLERVKKGQSGADILQIVRGRSGQVCGRILWEVKRTKAWNNTWLGKLRDDQQEAKADIAALMTETLPDDILHFDCREGVWVSSISTAVSMVSALRQGIMEAARVRASATSAGTKKDLVFSYLTGIEFRQRIRGLIEPITEMRASLDQEKRHVTKLWSTRERHIERVEKSVCMLYGELHGIIGTSLPSVEGLMLEDATIGLDARPGDAPVIGLSTGEGAIVAPPERVPVIVSRSEQKNA